MKEMKAILLKVFFTLAGCVLVVATGIKNLVPTIQLIGAAVISGVDLAVTYAEKPVKQYLSGLRTLLRITFLPPLLVGPVAFLFGWQPVMGWTGVWLVIWTLIVGHYAVLLGLLIEALGTIGRKDAWAAGETGLLARRLKSYIGFVRQVLIYETATFAVLNLVPFQNWWAAVPLFFLIVGLLLVTSYEWATGTGKWLKPVVRLGSFTALGVLLLGFIVPSVLPRVNFFHMFWYLARGQKIPEAGAYRGTKELQTTDVWNMVSSAGTWFAQHWVGVGIGIVVALVLAYVLKRMFGGTTEAAATDHHAATPSSHHGSGGTKNGWLWTAIGIGVLLLVMTLLGRVILGAHEDRSARIDARTAANREAHARYLASLAPSPTTRTVVATVAAPSQPATDVWCDLKNPTKYELRLTNNWSGEMAKPPGKSVRFAPAGLGLHIRINGTEILERNTEGTTPFPAHTRTFAVRMEGNTNPIDVVVGVGPRVR